MAKTRECCGALSLRRTGDDLHVSLHKGFKIRLAGIVPVFKEFTAIDWIPIVLLTLVTYTDKIVSSSDPNPVSMLVYVYTGPRL